MRFKGRTWPAEWKQYDDPETCAPIRQLTDYKGHSNHLYFTNSGWYDRGRRLIFSSDRENRNNLFSIDLETGAITQLTDFPPVEIERPYQSGFLTACVSPTCDVACFWHDHKVIALDLESLESWTLWEMPKGFLHHLPLNFTADGRYVCTPIFEDVSDRIRIDYERGYIGHKETSEAHPLSRIVRIAADGSGADTVWEERNWIGHVNTSPTQANILSFFHSGSAGGAPGGHFNWGLDLATGKVWKIRPYQEQKGKVLHDYWLADGVRIGYHGSRPDGQSLVGWIRYDNSERAESATPHAVGHTHSNDGSLIVGDGWIEGTVRLWKWNGEGYDGPRILCQHRCSFHMQKLHVHPRFSPNGGEVLFTSDMSGYGNLYLAHVPGFECLPEMKDAAAN